MGTSNKPVALVTGAAAGIGKATALAYAKAGCHLAISDVQADKLKSLTPLSLCRCRNLVL